MNKADLTKKPQAVSAMFDQVSTHYDRTNAVLSVGNDQLWRAATVRAVDPRPGDRILDLAAGTGTSSAALAAKGAHVIAADFSPGMIEVGKRQQAGNRNVEFVQADGMDLPFADDEFDAVTISFGLRNIVDPHVALAELYRVTKPGGRIVICEFSKPPAKLVRSGYFTYLNKVMPTLVKLASSNAEAYDYLGDSIKAWPDQKTLAEWMRVAGFSRVAYKNLSLGIVALHRGIKPRTGQ
ncbi:bifunctional demethylmenaquinone methyltransferase/2-methoxy-6-polyprenyl-1,4-benzoquinol methylase UbiE [Agreia pratensis]|uniref:bifunctional demethylmenaquinone methyltransferase/2-methoxy-6-polyprenyl-1,4-benzoquinol methylase UbiE n=1 Tax=Agreia pratensis TaxID=150121 RepID=UPI001FD2CCEA|nr:bifunctional demethylmenaquinone methyltransferase/2-methoxy-6-polyprenyl-1,4-benzoquinol methylase UbiE [Agreia pratensis]